MSTKLKDSSPHQEWSHPKQVLTGRLLPRPKWQQRHRPLHLPLPDLARVPETERAETERIASVRFRRREVTSEAPIVEDAKNASADAAAKLSPNLPLNGRSVQQLAKLEAGVSSDVEATARKEKLAAEAGRAQLKAKKADTGAAAGEMMSATLRDADEFRLSVLRTPSAKVFWVISKEV